MLGIQWSPVGGPRPPRVPPPSSIAGATHSAPPASQTRPGVSLGTSGLSPEAPSLSPEDVYIGVVKTQSKRNPSKYFIECRELQRLFSTDVKMEACEKPNDVQLGDLVVFMVAQTHGKINPTPVACGVKRLYYDVAHASSESMSEAELVYQQEVDDQDGEASCEQAASSSGARVLRGLVRNQSMRDPSKYFIECSELWGQYDCDVKLLSIEKPNDVHVGDTVEFVLMEVDVGAPLAVCVTRVPLERQQNPGSILPAASKAMPSAPRVIGAPPTSAAKRPRLSTDPVLWPAVRAS